MSADLETILIYLQRRYNILREVCSLTEELADYHKESMTARKGTPLREFYLSRARILYARRNISGGKKILSCLYLSLIAAPKKAVMYLLHGKCRLTISVLHGTLQGLITSKL